MYNKNKNIKNFNMYCVYCNYTVYYIYNKVYLFTKCVK